LFVVNFSLSILHISSSFTYSPLYSSR
jgi:hypothetical protein